MALIILSVLLALFAMLQARHSIDLFQQKEYFEGDILVDAKDRNAIFKTKRWTGGIIPYKFSDYWSEGYRRMVLTAMNEIQGHTCVRFVPKKDERDYIEIISGSGCYSSVGMEGGRQYVSLQEGQYGSCWTHGTIVHELLHAVGLWHEQSRPDRDDYVIIHFDNAHKSMHHNFEKMTLNNSQTYGVPYNYLSVMHYDKSAFSKKMGLITMETKDKTMQDRIGQNSHAVETDYQKIRIIYDCTGKYPTMPTPTLPPPTPPSPCVDKETYCKEYSDSCHEIWTQPSCRKTCNHCNSTNGTQTQATTPRPKVCSDTVDYCHEFGKRCKEEAWMADMCRKTCKLC